MINKSLWLKGVKTPRAKKISENIYTDVLIIGGGLTGISCAYHLLDSKKKVTIIDQGKVGMGATANSTGKLTYLQEDLLNKIDSVYGKKHVSLYLKSQIEAIRIVQDIIINNNIECNYESTSSYLFTTDKSKINKINNVENMLIDSKIDYKIREQLPITFPCVYGIKVDDTAVFNPVKYVMSIREIIEREGVEIYENTRATDFKKVPNGYMVTANNKKIFTHKLVIACHYPFFFTPYLFPFKTYLEKSYVTASKIEKNKKFNAINIDKETHSIRYYSDNQDYLVYGSESRQLGKSMDNLENYANICWKTKSMLTQDIKYCWFNYDLMTFDSLPIIGYLERDNYDLLVGTGYNTWGMTNGSLAGKILSDLILDKTNPYIELFDPHRSFSLMKMFNAIGGNLGNVRSLLTSKFLPNDSSSGKSVRIITKNKIKYGIYTDETGKEHTVLNTCPHMKCNLSFNNADKTWDCPCHGSRFDIDGNIVKGPSTYSIKVDKKDE